MAFPSPQQWNISGAGAARSFEGDVCLPSRDAESSCFRRAKAPCPISEKLQGEKEAVVGKNECVTQPSYQLAVERLSLLGLAVRWFIIAPIALLISAIATVYPPPDWLIFTALARKRIRNGGSLIFQMGFENESEQRKRAVASLTRSELTLDEPSGPKRNLLAVIGFGAIVTYDRMPLTDFGKFWFTVTTTDGTLCILRAHRRTYDFVGRTLLWMPPSSSPDTRMFRG
jgi:hypothetical protein